MSFGVKYAMAVKVTEQIDNNGITDFSNGEFRDRRTPNV